MDCPFIIATSGNANYIGQSNDLGSPQYFNGAIDEIRVWNIALSQSDIQANRFKTENVTIPGLVAAYDFNEGIAGGSNAAVTTLIDRSGNSRDGTLANFSLNGATSNWITATNSVSGFITLAAPSITGISPSVTVCSGVTTSFTVTIAGGAGAIYQWLKNGTAISGASAASLTLNSVTATAAGVYSVAIQSYGGNITSSGISLGLTSLPSIDAISPGTTVCVGTDVTLSLTAPGTNTIQWYKNAVSIPGANSSVLSISGALASNYSYYAQVYNSCGSVISTTVGVTIGDYVSITGITSSLNLCPGTNGVITVSGAGGGGNVTFQWYNNSVPISGANAINYTITGALSSNTGTYFVVVNALCGSATSAGSNVAVNCNNALSLDGTDDFVEVTVPGVLNTNVFTVECWAYCTGGSQYKAVLSKRDAGGWIIYFDASNNIALWNGYSPLITGPTASLNTWNHIAITSDNSGQSLYVNGILAGSSGTVLTPSPNNLRMGTDDGNQWYFGGKIDEVRLWSRVLSASELQSNLNCQLTGSELGLIAYYDFNQNAPGGNNAGKTTLLDRTANGNNGTLSNFALTGVISNWIVGSTSISGTCVLPTYAVYTIGGNGSFISNGSTSINTSLGTDFNMTLQGSSISRSFSINNTGIPDVVITAASITGANAGDFSFSVSPLGTITGGSSVNFTIDYNPASFCTGVATVKIFTNSLVSPVYQFNVSGIRILKTYAASVSVNSFCGSGLTNVSLTGSELGVTYSLRDGFTSTTLMTLAGTGSAMIFSNVTLTSGGYDLHVYGDHTGSGCQQIQMTGSLLTNVIFLPPVTATVSSAIICPGQTVTFNGSGAISYVWTGGVTDGTSFVPASTATYTVTGTDNNGCSNNAFATVTVNSPPNISVNASSLSVCPNTTVTLSGAGGIIYNWSNGVSNGVGFILTSTGTYSVTGSDAFGCVNTAQVVLTLNSPVSLSGLNTTTAIYGQPYSGIITSSGAGLVYSISGGSFPAGITLGVNTGILSGVPSVTGIRNFSITGNNGSCTNNQSYSITVQKASLIIGVVDTAIYQNQSIPSQLRVTVTGLATWDNSNVTRYGITTATSSIIGNYPVNIFTSGAALSNYNLTTIAGNLTIRSITGITVSARTMSKQYGLPVLILLGSYSVDGIAVSSVSLSGSNVVTINGLTETINTAYYTAANSLTGVGILTNIDLTSISITNSYRYNLSSVTGGQLIIDPLRLTIKADDKVWLDGQAQPTLTGTVKSLLTVNGISGIVPGDDVQITYDYDDGTVLTTTGPFSVIPEAKGTALSNYSFIMFSGTVRKLSGLTVTSFNFSKTYGTQPPMSLITASGTGYTVVGWKGTSTGYNVDNKPVLAGLGISAPVGQYAIVPVLTGYDFNLYYLTTVPGVLTVNPAGLTVLAVNFSKVQGDPNPTLTGQIIGLQSYDVPNFNVSYSTDADIASPVGDYPITSTVSGTAALNYIITLIPGTLKIGAAPGNLSVSAGSFSKVYGSDNPVFTGNITGLVAGDDVSPQYVTIATSNSPAGMYPINIVLNGADVGKYLVSTTAGTLTITKAPLTVKANAYTRPYGQPNSSFDGVITGLLPNDNISVIYESNPLTNANSTAGKYPIIPNVSGTILSNYNLTTITDTLEITKVNLSVLGVTLKKVFNAPNPALSYNIIGFVNNDNIQKIDTIPVGSTVATDTSSVGIYPIIYANGVDSNYVFTYGQGTLEITKASQTITVSSLNAKVKTGESIILSAASSSGLPLTVSVANASILSANGLIIKGLMDGQSGITISQGGNANYLSADSIFINVLSTSTGVVSVFSFVLSGVDTAYAGVSDLSYTFDLKADVTYQWTYTGSAVSQNTQTSANVYDIGFGNSATSGYVVGKVLDDNGNIVKIDSLYVTVISSDQLSNPDFEQKVIAAQLVKQLATVSCEPVATNCEDAYIDSFNLGVKLTNNSTCSKGGYGNFTTIGKIDSLIMGNSYPMRIVCRNSISSSNYFGIWIDYGNDGSFSDPDDFINASFSPDSVFELKNVVIRNNDTYIGPRRLRIGMRTSGAFVKSESCPAEGTIGETEDYLIYIRKQDALEAPKLITPNNDGKNDLFIVKGINPKLNNKLSILDRWGIVKFERENYENDWDGKDQSGITMVDGTYFYFFTNGDNLIKGYVEIKTR